jgi:hypothetical protein
MIVLVDTSVWSLVLRRKSRLNLPVDQQKHARALEDLIADARVALVGVVRQEILSGIKNFDQFVRLRDYLQGFPDVPLEAKDYEVGAEMANICRSHGIAGNPIDFLICAVAKNRDWTIYTLDQDFLRYSKFLHLALSR